MKASRIYTGWVRHRRFHPKNHEFQYRMFMMFLDLDELPELFDRTLFWSAGKPNLAWFRRADYLGNPAKNLASEIRRKVQKQTGQWPTGPIRMLTHLRYFGYLFNPVTFYYLYNPAGTAVETIAAEITNTPWGERHVYVLSKQQNMAKAPRKRFQFSKVFHVSPFLDMNYEYDWRFTDPSDRLLVHMENWKENERHFEATMNMAAEEITPSRLDRCLAAYPMMTGKVIAGIYLQAFKLWAKNVPFYPNPSTTT